MFAFAENPPWIETFRELLHNYLPPIDAGPLVNITCILAVVAGVMLVFKSAKLEKSIVTVFAVLLGAWGGYELSLLIGTPGPISAAFGAVGCTLVAYKTHRIWLAVGSVLVLFGIAILIQLGRGDLQTYIRHLESGERIVTGDRITALPADAAAQARNLHPDAWEQIRKIKTPAWEEIRKLGIVGWILPIVAAIAGGALAFWALRIFSAVWLSFVGAIFVLGGSLTLVGAHWPDGRGTMLDYPGYPFGGMVALWLLGLLYQAKKARLPRPKPSGGDRKKSEE